MPTATKTQNALVQEYYELAEFLGTRELLDTKDGRTMFLMDEKQLNTLIVKKLVRAFELGKLSVYNSEDTKPFNVEDYLIRK